MEALGDRGSRRRMRRISSRAVMSALEGREARQSVQGSSTLEGSGEMGVEGEITGSGEAMDWGAVTHDL